MGNITSVSLRVDEVKALAVFLKEYPNFKTKHEVLKFAIRRLLFPDEKTVPVNGIATIHPKEDGHPEQVTIERNEPEETLTLAPEERLEIIPEEGAENRRQRRN